MPAKNEQPLCIICLDPVEPWPGDAEAKPVGYGHNPEPWPVDEDAPWYTQRACNWCNENIVLPVRFRRAGFGKGPGQEESVGRARL